MNRSLLFANLMCTTLAVGLCLCVSTLAAQEVRGSVPAAAPVPSTAAAPAAVAHSPAPQTPKVAPAPLDPTVASRLSRLLKTRHECPPKEDFAALGIAAVAPELYRIARDPKVFPLYRFRALEALGYWPDDQVFELYVAVLASAVDDEPLQHDMIPLIVAVFGTQAIAVVQPYLDDPRIAIRLTVLRALSRLDAPAARKIIEERAVADPDEPVRTRAKRMLSRPAVPNSGFQHRADEAK